MTSCLYHAFKLDQATLNLGPEPDYLNLRWPLPYKWEPDPLDAVLLDPTDDRDEDDNADALEDVMHEALEHMLHPDRGSQQVRV